MEPETIKKILTFWDMAGEQEAIVFLAVTKQRVGEDKFNELITILDRHELERSRDASTTARVSKKRDRLWSKV